VFDFETAPLGGINTDPTYEQGDFTLTQVGIAPDAKAERVETTKKPGAVNRYAMRILALSKKPSGPLTVEVVFSEPATRVSMVVRNNATSGNAVITPDLLFDATPSSSGPHSHCPSGSSPDTSLDVPYTQGQYIQCVLEEFPNNAYEGFTVTASASDKFYWDDLIIETAECDPSAPSCSNLPLFPTDSPETFLTLNRLHQKAEVQEEGFYNINTCVFRDIREDEDVRRDLYLSEVVGPVGTGTGTCVGPYWENFIDENPDLTIDAMFRSFEGAFEGVWGHWVQLIDTSFTGAFHGPVLTTSFAENVIDFPITTDGELACDVWLSSRPLTLAFDNPDTGRANNRTVRCNRPESMTRRTIQTMPLRLAGFPILDELANIYAQAAATQRAVDGAKACATDDGSIENVRLLVVEGKDKLLTGHVDTAINLFEQAQVLAYALDVTPCAASENFVGELTAIIGALAFTAFDRVKHFDPDTWEHYTLAIEDFQP
jgi:hypothetical protein